MNCCRAFQILILSSRHSTVRVEDWVRRVGSSRQTGSQSDWLEATIMQGIPLTAARAPQHNHHRRPIMPQRAGERVQAGVRGVWAPLPAGVTTPNHFIAPLLHGSTAESSHCTCLASTASSESLETKSLAEPSSVAIGYQFRIWWRLKGKRSCDRREIAPASKRGTFGILSSTISYACTLSHSLGTCMMFRNILL